MYADCYSDHDFLYKFVFPPFMLWKATSEQDQCVINSSALGILQIRLTSPGFFNVSLFPKK